MKRKKERETDRREMRDGCRSVAKSLSNCEALAE